MVDEEYLEYIRKVQRKYTIGKGKRILQQQVENKNRYIPDETFHKCLIEGIVCKSAKEGQGEKKTSRDGEKKEKIHDCARLARSTVLCKISRNCGKIRLIGKYRWTANIADGNFVVYAGEKSVYFVFIRFDCDASVSHILFNR